MIFIFDLFIYFFFRKIEEESKSTAAFDRVPAVAQWVMNPTSIYEDVGSIPGLAQ